MAEKIRSRNEFCQSYLLLDIIVLSYKALSQWSLKYECRLIWWETDCLVYGHKHQHPGIIFIQAFDFIFVQQQASLVSGSLNHQHLSSHLSVLRWTKLILKRIPNKAVVGRLIMVHMGHSVIPWLIKKHGHSSCGGYIAHLLSHYLCRGFSRGW